jgi:hypothetical protein
MRMLEGIISGVYTLISTLPIPTSLILHTSLPSLPPPLRAPLLLTHESKVDEYALQDLAEGPEEGVPGACR